MMTRRIHAALTLLVLILVAGCGSNNQKLTGTVIYSDDGSPVKMGVVVMESNNKIARGEMDANGKFTMGFASDKDGIPKGETFKVTIVNALEETGTDKSGMPIMTPLIDPKYSNSNTSGLTFTSDGKTKTLDLKVDRYKK